MSKNYIFILINVIFQYEVNYRNLVQTYDNLMWKKKELFSNIIFESFKFEIFYLILRNFFLHSWNIHWKRCIINKLLSPFHNISLHIKQFFLSKNEIITLKIFILFTWNVIFVQFNINLLESLVSGIISSLYIINVEYPIYWSC